MKANEYNDVLKEIATKVFYDVKKDQRIDKAIISITGYLNKLVKAHIDTFDIDTATALKEASEYYNKGERAYEDMRNERAKAFKERREIEDKIDGIAEDRAKEIVRGMYERFISGEDDC